MNKSAHRRIAKRSIGAHYQRQCDAFFGDIVLRSLARFPPEQRNAIGVREKRQIVEFVTGYMVCNILSTVKDLFGTRTESRLEERVANAENRLAALNAQQDLMLLSQRALARASRAELKMINTLQGQVGQVADLGVLYDFFVSEMQRVRAKHDRLYSSLRTGNPDLTTIAEIFDTSMFGRLLVRDIEKVSVESPKPSVLRIRVEGPVRSRNTKVYDLIAFPFYTNFTGHSGWKREYVGNTRVMKNESINCVKGIGASAARKYVELTCDEANYRDPSVREWKSLFIEDLRKENLRPVSSIVWPVMRIQCFTRNLTISEGKKNWTTTCPAYVTSVHLRYSFHTSDGIINHIGGGLHAVHNVPKVNTDVLEFHFDDFEPAHKELEASLHETDRLLKKQRLLHNSTIAFTLNDQAVSIQWLAYGTLAVILAINLICATRIICKWAGNRSLRLSKHEAQPRDNRSSGAVAGAPRRVLAIEPPIELDDMQDQLAEQSAKLDALLQAANDLGTASFNSRRPSRPRVRLNTQRTASRPWQESSY